LSTPRAAFDANADAYDGQFTATVIGRMMRRAVWARCAARFSTGARVLEMNCGTGEDAAWLADRGIHVLATDASAAMLRVAQDKAAIRRSGRMRLRQLAWEQLEGLEETGFDGALSNFGGLNCIEDLGAAARALAKKLRPGGTALLCIMGPTVPWEWFWYLARGQTSKAFRRLRRGGTMWSGITIHYPTIRAARRSFAPEFKMLRVSAIGALIPPPYTESRFGRHAQALATLDWVERRLESLWPLPQLADHYLLELVRS
jgi:SAM-dependent methyltransferase